MKLFSTSCSELCHGMDNDMDYVCATSMNKININVLLLLSDILP